jgi:hypothetical protein
MLSTSPVTMACLQIVDLVLMVLNLQLYGELLSYTNL